MPNQSYDNHRERMGRNQRDQSESGRDIGKISPIKNKRRRAKCERDLPLYLKTYFPATFYLDWSPDQLDFLGEVQEVVLSGGRKAVGLSRGGGKTQSIARSAGCWAPSYGHRNFIALIGAEEQAAKELVELVRIEWETNDLLLEDFPEIAYPIRKLEGINQRANGQTSLGKRTHITWTDSEVVYPTIPGSPASGATVRAAGILGRLRGMFRVNPSTGKTERPGIFLADDFQTDASARSDPQCSVREMVINGALLGLGGPGKTVAGLACSTIIRHGDTASRIFNRKLYPRWRGTVYKLVYKWPSSKKANELWEQYLEIRAEELADGIEQHPKANAFYKKHRKVMDDDAKVAWENRKEDHELSALQHAFGLRADNPASFDAEYQNDPKPLVLHESGIELPSSDDLVLKTGQYKRGVIPEEATHLIAGVDVQGNSLWWVVVAVDDNFSGWVVDRGVWPDQYALGHYFTLAQIRDHTMLSETGEPNDETALAAALGSLCGELFGRQWSKPSGEVVPLELALIDARHETKTVHSFCRTTPLNVMPAQGIGVTAKSIPWEATKRKKGERRGPGWKTLPTAGTEQVRTVSIDTNFWQTTLVRRWSTAIGAAGSWHLYRAPHVLLRMLADHLCSETPVETSGRGRKLYEWSLRLGSENHWNDGVRMAAVGASMLGVLLPGEVRKRSRGDSAEPATSKGTAKQSRQAAGKPTSKQQPNKSMQQRREEAKQRAAKQKAGKK